MKAALLLLTFVQASPAVPPPEARPFDCSWIYHPPTGPRARYEGVYFSFIDDRGFVACSSVSACKDWMGKKSLEIDFSRRVTAELDKRRVNIYGVFRIVFEGRPGKLGDRPGCETNEWSLDAWGEDYVRVDRLLKIERHEDRAR